MIFKQQSPQNTQSARLKYQSDSLRKQFLSQLIVQPSSSNTSQSQSLENRNISKPIINQSRGSKILQNKKKYCNADSSSDQEEHDQEEIDNCGSDRSQDGVNSDQDLENSGNIKSNISNSGSGDDFMYNKETCIVRNSKNWKDLKISLDSQSQQQQNPNPIQFLLKNQQSSTKIFPKSPPAMPDQPTLSKKSLAACSSATPHSTIQLTNYRTILKNQIKKSRNLEQQLSKQNHRNNLLIELVKKLKQENQVLRKVVKKSVHGNQGTNFKKKNDKTIKTVKNRERNI